MKDQDLQPIDGEFVEEPKTAVVIVEDKSDFMPTLSTQDAEKRYRAMQAFIKSQMTEGVDYGTIPGTGKPTLYKPGAEKLTTFFGLRVKFVEEKTIEEWDKPLDPLFFYRRKCQLYKGDTLIAEASGSANSYEGHYRWRWVKKDKASRLGDLDQFEMRDGTIGEWGWAYEKREKSGRYGKPELYWKRFDDALENGEAKKTQKAQSWDGKMNVFIEIPSVEYRVPNDDIFTLVNTILKMAEKRALVAATLIACNASDYFTQDVEDMGVGQPDIPVESSAPVPKQPPPDMSDEEAAINWAREVIRGGKFPPNEYIKFAETLGFESVYATEVKNDCIDQGVEEPFTCAVTRLVDEYRKINS